MLNELQMRAIKQAMVKDGARWKYRDEDEPRWRERANLYTRLGQTEDAERARAIAELLFEANLNSYLKTCGLAA